MSGNNDRLRNNSPMALLRYRLSKARRRFGMRPRLMVVLVLMALAPLSAQFVLDYFQTRKYMQQRAHIALEHIANVQQRRMNQELTRMRQGFELVASRTQMRISLSEYLQAGKQTALDLLTRIITDALNSSESYKEIWIRDLDGNLISGVAKNSTPADSGVPPLMPSSSLISTLAWLDNDIPDLWLAGPLVLQGETIGILYILSTFDHVIDVMQDFACRDVGGRTQLVLPDKSSGFKVLESRCNLHDARVTFSLRDIEEMGLDFEAFLQVPFDKPVQLNNQLLIMRPLDDSLGYVLTDISFDFLHSYLMVQIRSTLALLFFFSLLGLFLAAWLAKVLTRPLDHLVEATRRLRRGDQNTRIKNHYWGEFIELRRSFNQMAAKLARQTSSLKQEIHTRSQSQKILTDLANTDGLTRLMNRRHFMDILTNVVTDADQDTYVGALLYVDLDRFKPINDTFGHEAGDAVLQIVAERLQHLLREGDIAARMGGDEFALFLPPVDGKDFDPRRMAERVEQQLSHPIAYKGQEFSIGCSIGITGINANESPQDIVNRADAAMYQVKLLRKKHNKDFSG